MNDLRFNLDVLNLCDRALDAGLAISRKEHALMDTFLDAKAELNDVLQTIAKAAGGIRGHELCTQSGRDCSGKEHHIYVIPGGDSTAPYVNRMTGEIGQCKEPKHLIYIWHALPGILARHIARCQDDSERSARTANKMTTIWHGSQVLRSFVKAAMPSDRKWALMERVLTDTDLQDALKTAAATGEDEAPLKVLREQIDPEDEDEQEAVDG